MDWKNRTLLVAVVAGAILGFLAAQMYIRQVEDSGVGEPPKINTGSALTIGLSALGVIRQVAALGSPED